ncbi:Unknown protein [Striga hermonthica]|uniref:F-box domain-containing protein n=1 Tax=Striga hermonthica TaxID=68872 RepID=A0A9N7N5K1_STRHE|nr:Unknown protein [Striga hermonthica]
MDSVPKRRKYQEIDIISNLPDEIRCHILSFLPTKFAVGTTILSTKWRNLLPSVPNLKLQLHDSLLLDPKSNSSTQIQSFVKFADNLLKVTLRNAISVQSLVILCKKLNDARPVATWISSALLLGIQRLAVQISSRLRHPSALLSSLNGSNLGALYLRVDLRPKPNPIPYGLVFSFPKLKVLVFHSMDFNLVNSVLLGCPVLEVLVVNNCTPSFFPGEMLSIRVPSLKVLWLYNMMNVFFCVLELNSPGLLHFFHFGYMPIFYRATKMRSLSVARLSLNEIGGQRQVIGDEQAIVAINACSDVARILLTENFISMLYRCPQRIPSFPKMVDLGIVGMNHSNGWEVLLGFVARAPNLKNIYVKANFHAEGYERFKAALKETMTVVVRMHNPDMFQLKIERNAQNGENCVRICGGAVAN